MFSLVAAMLFADQNLLAPHLTAVGRAFHFTDAERDAKLGGVSVLHYMGVSRLGPSACTTDQFSVCLQVIMGAFFIVGAPAALLCGWLADRLNRVYLLFAVVGPTALHSII